MFLQVMLAVGICAVLCFALTVFAFQTKIDFTVMGGILMAACLILFIFGIVLMFFTPSKPVRLIYAGFGTFLFSVYLIYDTQLMVGGSHKYSISPEEYVFAALNIYLDIVTIFIYILSIIGETRD